MITKEELAQKIKSIFVETFELDEAIITPTAHLRDDLDLDSIDAIEIVVLLEQEYNKKITEEKLRAIQTVQDVIDTVHGLLLDGK